MSFTRILQLGSATLTGLAFLDNNRNGLFDCPGNIGEFGIPGIRIDVLECFSGTVIASQHTNFSGDYSLTYNIPDSGQVYWEVLVPDAAYEFIGATDFNLSPYVVENITFAFLPGVTLFSVRDCINATSGGNTNVAVGLDLVSPVSEICGPTLPPSITGTSQPNVQPIVQPVVQPNVQPFVQPFVQPNVQPFAQPNIQPFVQPFAQPHIVPQPMPHPKPMPQPMPHPQPRPQPKPMPQPRPQSRGKGKSSSGKGRSPSNSSPRPAPSSGSGGDSGGPPAPVPMPGPMPTGPFGPFGPSKGKGKSRGGGKGKSRGGKGKRSKSGKSRSYAYDSAEKNKSRSHSGTEGTYNFDEQLLNDELLARHEDAPHDEDAPPSKEELAKTLMMRTPGAGKTRPTKRDQEGGAD
mmetsp:Transcript_6216/g.9454  ORF Transcript_6216/g.9454 Transcript_6216/m.9454 type:complete len:405 (+) Transcript_6216:69-1283(+)